MLKSIRKSIYLLSTASHVNKLTNKMICTQLPITAKYAFTPNKFCQFNIITKKHLSSQTKKT